MADNADADLERLLTIIQDIAAGHYSNDIMDLTLPSTPEPIQTIAEAMAMMMVKVEAREYRLELLVEELKQLNERIRQNAVKTVSAMAQALEARDAYTRGHTSRVARIAVEIAREMGAGEAEMEAVRIGGILHDIGKIGFSDRLFQPHEGKNPPDVIKEITRHPATGAEILKELDFLGDALEFIHSHHERPDGKGYPRQLKPPHIPLGALIIAVADAYDAMTTDRPYQKARPPETALGILMAGAGTHWDSECVAAFERVLTREGCHRFTSEGEGSSAAAGND